jgi:predicted component of type VI protein secretion system
LPEDILTSPEIKFNPETKPAPVYTNIATIGFTAEEAVVNFGLREFGSSTEARYVAQVIMTISHAKRLARALTDSIEDYEKRFGEIDFDPSVTRLRFNSGDSSNAPEK